MIKYIALFCVCCCAIGCVKDNSKQGLNPILEAEREFIRSYSHENQCMALCDLTAKLGQPDRKLHPNEVYTLLISKFGSSSLSNSELAKKIMMHKYSSCSGYLIRYEPLYNDWKMSEKFKNFEFYFYNSLGKIQKKECVHLGGKSESFYLPFYLVDGNNVIAIGDLPQI